LGVADVGKIGPGISGPGKPFDWKLTRRMGYHTDRNALLYRGDDPIRPGWRAMDPETDATGAVVDEGLLPPIKPIWNIHLRDTVIRLAPDGYYYMIGTTGDNCWLANDGIELWRSKDLQHWKYLGFVWGIDRDGLWQKSCWGKNRQGQPIRYLWAPDINFIDGKPVIATCVGGGRGVGGTFILRSVTGKPKGPYVDAFTGAPGPITTGIDASLFQDDDGKVYFTHAGGAVIREVKRDLSGWAGPEHAIEFEAPASVRQRYKAPAFEGATVFKRNGKYYMTGAYFYTKGRYSSVAVISDNIYGPYKHWHEAVPCGGGGNYFQDKNGDWFCAIFGNDKQAPFREMPGVVKIEFDAEGLIHVAKRQPSFVLSTEATDDRGVEPGKATPAKAKAR
jgi:hypothetical protein